METVDILGVPVAALDMAAAVDRILGWVETRTPAYVLLAGMHGIMECQRDAELLAIYRGAAMCAPDGMPTVWLGRAEGHRTMDRVYGPDLMLEVLGQGLARGLRHVFYGGVPGVAEELRDRMTERFPGLQVVGAESPPFRPLTPGEDEALCARLDAAAPDIVWVGISTPKQDRWMAAHVGRLRAPVLVGVGAAFDFHTGRVRQAPRMLQRAGLEWAFRMAMEPRRLAPRYLVNVPKFLGLLLLEGTGIRRPGRRDG